MQPVIERTFDGYVTEIKTLYGQLEKELGAKIEPAPDEWDRIFNVDFFIKIKDNYIGIQIKPVNQGIQLSQIFKEKDLQSKTHEKFTRQYGGKVFYIFSSKAGEKKEIRNKEVIDEIRQEMEQLKVSDHRGAIRHNHQSLCHPRVIFIGDMVFSFIRPYFR